MNYKFQNKLNSLVKQNIHHILDIYFKNIKYK